MGMEVVNVRLPKKVIRDIDKEVKKGDYANKSDYIRDTIRRRLRIHEMVGTIPNTGDSVKEVREIRKKLSKEKIDLDEINKFGK